MPTAWTQITASTGVWSEIAGISAEYHLTGSPIGLLLSLTHYREGDNIWERIQDSTITWTEI